jgi:hypothetical protein
MLVDALRKSGRDTVKPTRPGLEIVPGEKRTHEDTATGSPDAFQQDFLFNSSGRDRTADTRLMKMIELAFDFSAIQRRKQHFTRVFRHCNPFERLSVSGVNGR